MTKMLHSFFLVLAQATHDELIRQIQYLKVENEILRSKLPKKITVTPAERRRLLKFGKLVGSAIKELISIVHPRTFARWLSDEKKGKAVPIENSVTLTPQRLMSFGWIWVTS